MKCLEYVINIGKEFVIYLLLRKTTNLTNYVIFSLMLFFLYLVPLPCIMSDWSAWSKYDAAGVSYRFRQTLRPALNGGKECPDELIQLRKSKLYTK